MKSRSEHEGVLLVGPLPPPEGGARLSFSAALGFFRSLSHLSIDHHDLPVRNSRAGDPPGDVDHPRTIAGLIRAAVRIPRADAVVVFGSSRFCFSYGLVLVLGAKLFRRHCAVRFFGGRPALAVTRLPVPIGNLLCAFLRQADTVVVQTEVGRRELPASLRAKVKVVRGYRPRPVDSRPVDRKVDFTTFVCVGMTLEKGAGVLLDAFDDLRGEPLLAARVELHVYGTGPAEVMNRAMRTPGVAVHGRVPHDHLRAALQQHDVLVFPSLCITEGHPGVVIEALMAGLPIIAGDLPGPMELLRHEANSLIVKTGDPRALATAMVRLANDVDLRVKLRAGVRASALRFDQALVLPELATALGLHRV